MGDDPIYIQNFTNFYEVFFFKKVAFYIFTKKKGYDFVRISCNKCIKVQPPKLKLHKKLTNFNFLYKCYNFN